MDQIIPGLWVGDLFGAQDEALLVQNNIGSILSVMAGRFRLPEKFIRHQIEVIDSPSQDILVHFLPAIEWVQGQMDKGRVVLVHCAAGASRSVTIVAAYLIHTRGIDAQSAVGLIQKVRSIANPNSGFMTQLETFHKSIPRESVLRPLHNVVPSPITRRRIRCKMCRQELATRDDMLDHMKPQIPPPPLQPLDDEAPQEPVPAPLPEHILLNLRCSGYFVEPLEWMNRFLASGESAGKIVCPNAKCRAKLGNYDWAGVCCGCKEWVTPGFCINRSKVDEVA